jgi:signal peptidase
MTPPGDDEDTPAGPRGDDPSGPGDAPDRPDDAADQFPAGGRDDDRAAGTRDRAAGPASEPRGRAGGDDEGEEMDWRVFAYDVVSSAVAVVLVGAMLFAVSGVWPPMVAVESPSMTPHMKTGDLVFVMDEKRFPGDGATGDTGVVTAYTGEQADVDYRKFQVAGDVIVYEPDGNGGTTPIIHRAMFWVEEGENWYERADQQSLGRYSECGDDPSEALPNCPAPHDGFITKGDANSRYDQVDGLSGPVRAEWVVGTAEVRVPKLGCVRLRTEGCLGVAAAPLGSASARADGSAGTGNATRATP